MLPGPLQVGDLLAERYRLLDPVASADPDSPTVLWRARDEVLARDVAVRLLPAGKRALQPVLEAAAAAGRASHPGLLRVLDATVEPGPRRGRDIAYVIREWVDGEPLDEHLLRTGERSGPDAADLVRQVADALAALHQQGLAHGRLHPGNVVVTTTGRIRLADAVIAAAALGNEAEPEPVVADTRDAGAVLYALLTAHWPTTASPQPRRRLPAAPRAQRQDVSPHQLRGGVSRQLDHVVLRALAPSRLPALPPLRTPAALADAAEAATRLEREERQAAAEPRSPGWVRRHRGGLAAAAVVALFAGVGWYAGLTVGELPRNPDAVDLGSTSSPSPGASASPPPAALDLRRAQVRDFDPLGDRQENPDQVRNALDGDTTTAWFTQRYRTATFSGLKQGVGLVVDLGSAKPVSQVRVGLTAKGAALQLRTSSSDPASLDQTREVAEVTSAGTLATLRPPTAVRTRWLLVWVTGLPRDPDEGYRVGITDLAVG